MSKGKSRRSNTKFSALDPLYNLKMRYDSLDYDYLNKLTDEEKQWLNDFHEEYINASLGKKPRFHKTKKLKKDCYDRNNSRNRDILNRAKAQGKCVQLEDDMTEKLSYNAEDKLIDKIDEKLAHEKLNDGNDANAKPGKKSKKSKRLKNKSRD